MRLVFSRFHCILWCSEIYYFFIFFLKDIIGYDTLPQENINRDGQLIGDTTAPTVNPLELPYFMAATVGKSSNFNNSIFEGVRGPSLFYMLISVMSFGLIFVVIAITWLK